MMRLLIQFYDDELADFRWATFDETDASSAFGWQHAGDDEMSTIATQNPHPSIIIIPQQCVYLTQIELPEKAGRQLLGAIEYQVEDQLAQDIDSQHFALGDTSDNPIAVAVVSRVIMERCMTLAQRHDLRLLQVVPELFLCPWYGSGVGLIEGYHGYLLRYGNYRGLKCDSRALPAMLELVKRDIEIDRITFYGNDAQDSPTIEGFSFDRQLLDTTPTGLVNAPLVNLQQREFQQSSAWKSLGRIWKWVGLLFAILLAIGTFNKAVALQELEHKLVNIRQQQYELIKAYLPSNATLNDDLKNLLIDRLKEIQAGLREQDFLQLLLRFTGAHGNYPGVEISRVGYQGNRLSFEISSSQLNDIEALLDTLKKQGINARLESLNIKPGQSSGRLVLQGGGNV